MMRRSILAVIAISSMVTSTIAISAPAIAAPFPSSVPLPVDFAPEGIALGAGSTFYVGSLTTGVIVMRRRRARRGAGAP